MRLGVYNTRQIAGLVVATLLLVGGVAASPAVAETQVVVGSQTPTLSLEEAYQTVVSVGMGEKNMRNMPRERVNDQHWRITFTGPGGYTLDVYKSKHVYWMVTVTT